MKSSILLGTLGGALETFFDNEDAEPLGGRTGPVEFRPGLLVPALDNWGACSMLWITAGQRWRSNTFPAMTDVQTCTGQVVLEATVGVSRCSTAFGDAQGNAPSAEVLAREMDVQEDDKDRLEAAVCRAMRDLKNDRHVASWSRGPTDVQGPDGGTVAVYISLMAAMTQTGIAG